VPTGGATSPHSKPSARAHGHDNRGQAGYQALQRMRPRTSTDRLPATETRQNLASGPMPGLHQRIQGTEPTREDGHSMTTSLRATLPDVLDTSGSTVLACTNQDGDPSAKRVPASQVTPSSLARLLGDRRLVGRGRTGLRGACTHEAPVRRALVNRLLLSSHLHHPLSPEIPGTRCASGDSKVLSTTTTSRVRHAGSTGYVGVMAQ